MFYWPAQADSSENYRQPHSLLGQIPFPLLPTPPPSPRDWHIIFEQSLLIAVLTAGYIFYKNRKKIPKHQPTIAFKQF